MLSVNTNRYQLAAARIQTQAQQKVDVNFQRLSAGKRINNAVDDSAGLQISNRLSKNINAGQQVSRNLNDGISYAEIAEGGLSQISDTLQRMRTLSIQAQNGINSPQARQALDKEYQQLKEEIDAIAFGTKAFSKLPLLGDDEIPTNNVPRIDALLQNGVARTLPSGLQSIAFVPPGSTNLVFQLDSFAVNDDIQVFTTAGKHLIGSALNAGVWQAGGNGISNPADLQSRFFYPENGYLPTAVYDNSELNTAGTSTSNGMTFIFSGDNHPTSYLENLSIDVVTEPIIISVVGAGSFRVTATWDSIGTAPVPGFDGQPGGVKITASITPLTDRDFIEMVKTPATLGALGLNNTLLDPDENAATALTLLDLALADVSEKRSYYGAKLNQMQTAKRNIENNVEQTSRARSQIQDTDFAKETAELISNQIIQDSSAAVLAQANQVPEQILSLLNSAVS